MNHLLIYLLKAGAWLAPFYLLYLLVFRRFSFYALNRVYLLAALAASFVLPFVQYTIVVKETIQVERPVATATNSLAITEPEPLLQPQTLTAIPKASLQFSDVLLIIYVIGAAFMLFRLIKNLFSLFRIIRNAEKEKKGRLVLVYAPSQTGHASFFNYILLDARRNDQKNLDLVVAHEKIHVQRLHSLDILLCELLKVIHWFNPFVWLYKKSLGELHEFEADALSAQQTGRKDYAALLLQLAVASRSQLASTFSRHPLKTRITRLFTPQTPTMKKLLFLLVLPVTIALLFAFKSITRKTVPVWTNAPLVVMIDAGHGGSQSGVQDGDVFEKTLTLSIAEKLKQHAEAAGMQVMMTRTADNDVSINERVELARTQKPDILVSIHISSALDNHQKNGIECFAGPNNAPQHATASVTAANYLLSSLSLLQGISVKKELVSRKEGIGIMKMVNCPAILLECGYLSNKSDRTFITDAGNQDQLAKQIAEGLVKFAAARKAPETGKAFLPPMNEVVPMEARTGLHRFSAEGVVIIDGKQVGRSLLPEINPALITRSVYFEENNEVAIKKYGERARNGLLVLKTKSGTGVYAFGSTEEKEKWMEVARAKRRLNTADKYDHFTYTDIDGRKKEVLVTAGGRNTSSPEILRFMLHSNKDGKFGRPLVFAVDGNEVTEEAFRQAIAKVPVNGFEWVHPFVPSKTEEPIRIEIRRLNVAVWGVEGFIQNLENISPSPRNEYGC